MWYFDRYMSDKNLTASLYYYDFENGSEGSNTKLLTGILTSKYNFDIRHKWSAKGTGNLIKDLTRLGVQIGQTVVGGLAEQGISYGATLGLGNVKTQAISNRVITSNNNMFKAFDGTEIEIEKPVLEVYLLTATENDNIFKQLWCMTGSGGIYGNEQEVDSSNFFASDGGEVIGSGNMRFLGGFQAGKTYNITMPPGKFRFTYNGDMDPNKYQAGTYKLITNRFLMTNLVLESMRVEFSNSISAISGYRLGSVSNNTSDTTNNVVSGQYNTSNYPLYAKVTLGFDWCVQPTHATIIKLLMSTPSEDSDNLGDARYDQGLSKL